MILNIIPEGQSVTRLLPFFNEKLGRNITALRDVKLNEVGQYRGELSDSVYRRAHHVVSENERVLASVEALKNNDFEKFGQLMIESHQSLRDDYEVSCRELDCLVDVALKQEGVLGARMTGAGFGGCTVNLVDINYVEVFIKGIKEGYKRETGIEPEIYVSRPAEGARRLEVDRDGGNPGKEGKNR